MVLKFLLIENFAIFINKCFQQMLIKEGAFQPIEQMREEKKPKIDQIFTYFTLLQFYIFIAHFNQLCSRTKTIK